ncbi:tyrosine-type recombinase/integrase [Sphingopyxis witflariensis]|uniref:Integrase n=1 Tax=Sphingopyxis witflariensis TaxID=173675 RepID=A0A246JZF5_9SPHN|nr:tyrosine-type recombinase/integrase [Sphingopyxis witflariensis]OWQ98393.1 integrase [Sphingopyxis witflariensis]
MTRRLTETAITSRSARKALEDGIYWRGIDPDVHIGYRKGKRGGRWLARWYVGDQKYSQAKLGTADDVLSEGNLSYEAAVKAARVTVEQARLRVRLEAAGPPVTVKSAVETYTAMRDARDTVRKGRPSRSDASSRLTLHVLSKPKLAEKALCDLRDHHLKTWLSCLDADLKLATKRRLINDFKAALNLAFIPNRAVLPTDFDKTVKFGLALDEAVSDDAIQEVRESQILKDEQIRRVIEVAQALDQEGDFARLVIVLAATGTRFSQAKRILVGDVQIQHSRLLVPNSWKGKKYGIVRVPVPVGRDVLEALTPAIEGRSPSAPLLERWHHEQTGVAEWKRTARVPWKTASEMTRMWNKVLKAAGLQDVVVYSLRHSSIVRGIRAGLPIRLVAASHDTSVQMIERHYSRWITDGLEELTARAVVPLVG